MKPIATLMLGLSSLWASAALAQTPPSTAPAAHKAAPLPTLKVQPPRAASTRRHTGHGAGKQRTVGYQENDVTAAKFGSKHWWTVQAGSRGAAAARPGSAPDHG